MDNKRVGIITGDTGLFSSGLIQNAYFIYMVYKKLGYKCDLLCWNSNYTKLDYNDIPIKTITEDETKFKVSNYKLIITVSAGITEKLYKQCKKYKVYVAGFVCGNLLCMNLERWIMPTSSSSVIGKERPVDALWVIGAFEYMKTYVELMRGVRARMVPHLWSPCLLEDHTSNRFKKSVSDLMYNPALRTTNKIDIIIIESNINFVKTALVPVMAAEKFHIDNPSLLNQVFVFGFPMQSKDAEHIVNNLTIKDKVRKFKSLHISEVMTHFNKGDTMPIFVSHQLYTHWNYLYYELMYYGYPLVHNSNLLKDYCYQYNEFDISTCAEKIKEACLNHNENVQQQLTNNRKYLESIDPAGPESMAVWKALAESVA